MPSGSIPVLFLCRDGAARGPMAAALLAVLGGGRYHGVCACPEPGPIHPHAREVLAQRGVDLAVHAARPLLALLGRESYAFGIVLMTPDEHDAPRLFPGAMTIERWDVPDPGEGGPAAFQGLYELLALRINGWVAQHAQDRELVLVGH